MSPQYRNFRMFQKQFMEENPEYHYETGILPITPKVVANNPPPPGHWFGLNAEPFPGRPALWNVCVERHTWDLVGRILNARVRRRVEGLDTTGHWSCFMNDEEYERYLTTE